MYFCKWLSRFSVVYFTTRGMRVWQVILKLLWNFSTSVGNKRKTLVFFFVCLWFDSVFYAKNKTKNTESDCHFYIAVPKIEVTYSYTSNIRVIWFNFYLLFIAFFNWKKSQFWNLSSQQIFICSFSWFIVVLPDSDLLCVLKMIRSL